MAKFNPYRPGAVVMPGMFSGRLNELQIIKQSLFQTKNGNPQHFLIEGERGIGKSSLLLFVDFLATGQLSNYDDEVQNFLVVNIALREEDTYIDILLRIINTLKIEIGNKEKLKALATQILDSISQIETTWIKINRTKSETDRTTLLDELTRTLVKLIQNANKHIDGVLILIDEADKPAPSAHLGEFCKLLTEKLTRGNCERVCLGLAGLPDLVPKLRESHASAPRLFKTMVLEPLKIDECERVIDRGLKEANQKNNEPTSITTKAKSMVADLSEGYPHFLQEFASCAFQNDTNHEIDDEDVKRGAFGENGAFDQLGKKFFTDMYFDQIWSDDYRRVLDTMTEYLDGWVKRADIIQKSGLKPSTVDNALRALKERKIIVDNKQVRGQYRLPTKSFAVWIKAGQKAQDEIIHSASE